MRLKYTVWDNSGITNDVIAVFSGRRTIAAGATGFGRTRRGVVYSARWRVPKRRLRNLRFCVLSGDRAGNKSNVSCAKIAIS